VQAQHIQHHPMQHRFIILLAVLQPTQQAQTQELTALRRRSLLTRLFLGHRFQRLDLLVLVPPAQALELAVELELLEFLDLEEMAEDQ